MANEIKVKKHSDVLADDARKLREATKLMTGQADRTNNLFVDVLLDLIDRVEYQERLTARWAEAERKAYQQEQAA